MTPVLRLASIHLGLLLLSIPLIMLLCFDGVATALGPSDKWAFVAVAAVYAIIAITGKPMALLDGLGRLGVSRRAGHRLVVTVALFALSVAVYDVNGIGTALGALAIVGALVLFLWTVCLALFGGTPGA
jgi:hypothetical protein